jgi:hypothetical protein
VDRDDLDKPQPPGSPMRRDEPSASVNPGEPGPDEPHEPEVVPSSTPDGPQTVPVEPDPDGEPAPEQPEPRPGPAGAPDQLENAATSMDEPSDDSGSEGESR